MGEYVNEIYSKNLESGEFEGYKVTTNLVSTINVEKSDEFYQIDFLANTEGRSYVLARGIQASFRMKFYGKSINTAFAHETGHLMGNDDEYIFNDANNDGVVQEGEQTETDPGSIMGIFYKHENPKVRDRHLYKALETANREAEERKKREKKKDENQN